MPASLVLAEIVPQAASYGAARRIIERAAVRAAAAGADLIEAEVTEAADRIFLVFEAVDVRSLGAELLSIDGVDSLEGPDPVRLVGADLSALRETRPDAGYLAEWDLPASLDMEAVIALKKEKAPVYADIPGVTFLRSYVREDLTKSLGLYDGADEGAVRRARETAAAPLDRLHVLQTRVSA